MHMQTLETLTINREWGNEVATLFGSMATLLYHELDDRPRVEAEEHMAGRVGTTFDRMLGGALFYATYAVEVLAEVIDWDAFNESENAPCVFSYDYLEHPGLPLPEERPCDHLAGFLLYETLERDWYQIAENWKLPTRPEMEGILRRWAEMRNIPLKG